MPFANKSTFTVGDLSRIALGSEELTNEHLNVLQSLFIILLQKLNCQNETVKIKGLAGKCLQKLLNENSNSCQYDFQTDKIQNFQDKYDLLDKLEEKVQDIENKLNQHFQHIRGGRKPNIFFAKNWLHYPKPTEDLCIACLKQNMHYCSLAANPVFNTQLRKRVLPPVEGKFKQFETRIDSMQNQLEEVTKATDEANAKLKNVEFIINDLENLRSLTKLGEKEFRATVSEIEQMLSCKLHRVALPALKKYLEKCFAVVHQHLRVLKLVAKKCPPAKPLLIEDKKTCLSCSQHKDIDFMKKFNTLKSVDEDTKCSCCNLLKDPSILEKIDRMKFTDLPVPSTSRQRYSRRSFKSPRDSGNSTIKKSSLWKR